jgi:chromosome segregation ATPase
VAHDDIEGAAAVNETIELWTKMCKAEADRNKTILLRFESMMSSFESSMSQLMESIDKIQLWAQAESILKVAKSWAEQTRISVTSEQRALLSKLESLEIEISEGEASREHLSSQVISLQDWKRKLEASLAEMVPKSELALERAHSAQRQAAADERIKALQESLAALKQENDEIKAALQVLSLGYSRRQYHVFISS